MVSDGRFEQALAHIAPVCSAAGLTCGETASLLNMVAFEEERDVARLRLGAYFGPGDLDLMLNAAACMSIRSPMTFSAAVNVIVLAMIEADCGMDLHPAAQMQRRWRSLPWWKRLFWLVMR